MKIFRCSGRLGRPKSDVLCCRTLDGIPRVEQETSRYPRDHHRQKASCGSSLITFVMVCGCSVFEDTKIQQGEEASKKEKENKKALRLRFESHKNRDE